jgi:hypothetical protein
MPFEKLFQFREVNGIISMHGSDKGYNTAWLHGINHKKASRCLASRIWNG